MVGLFVQPATAWQSEAPSEVQSEASNDGKSDSSDTADKLASDLQRLTPPFPERVSQGELEASIDRGAKHLVESQRKNGCWGGPQWTGGVDRDPVPGSFRSFDVAVTAMCLEALLDVAGDESIRKANERAYQFLLSRTGKIKRAGPGDLPQVWAYCYCIQTFSKMYARESSEEKKAELKTAIEAHMQGLVRWQSIHGGWFYYGSGMAKPINPSCSFVNAAVLVALKRAKEIGIEFDKKTLDKAIRATKMMRKPDSTYLYTARIPGDMSGAAREINRPAGSLGRSQACNIALRLWGDPKISDDVVRIWLNRLISRHGWLDMGRKKPIPHESFAAVAGYFYYFGVYYGSVNLEVLEREERAFYQHHLALIIMDRQEKDGSWFDYPLYSYHKPYGTAFAMLALQRCRTSQ